jgi:hypothetical protein
MEFEIAVPSKKGMEKFTVAVDHEKGKISADMRSLPAKPRLASTYELG